MLVTQIERGYHFIGLHVNTSENIAQAKFAVYEEGQRVGVDTYDADVAATEAAMNGPIPEGAATLYEAVGTVLFGMALQSGRFKGTLVSLNAPLPEPQGE